jgi:hypothetical protein
MFLQHNVQQKFIEILFLITWRWRWEWDASFMCPSLFLLVTDILNSDGQHAINVIPWRGQTGLEC